MLWLELKRGENKGPRGALHAEVLLSGDPRLRIDRVLSLLLLATITRRMKPADLTTIVAVFTLCVPMWIVYEQQIQPTESGSVEKRLAAIARNAAMHSAGISNNASKPPKPLLRSVARTRLLRANQSTSTLRRTLRAVAVAKSRNSTRQHLHAHG